MATGWWPEVQKQFTISALPTFVTKGAPGATFGITLTPTFGFSGHQH